MSEIMATLWKNEDFRRAYRQFDEWAFKEELGFSKREARQILHGDGYLYGLAALFYCSRGEVFLNVHSRFWRQWRETVVKILSSQERAKILQKETIILANLKPVKERREMGEGDERDARGLGKETFFMQMMMAMTSLDFSQLAFQVKGGTNARYEKALTAVYFVFLRHDPSGVRLGEEFFKDWKGSRWRTMRDFHNRLFADQFFSGAQQALAEFKEAMAKF